MMSFIKQLRQRNSLLYYAGWACFALALICALATQVDSMELLGINRWIKPMKFSISIGLTCWTMAWLLHYLEQKKQVSVYSWVLVIILGLELGIVIMQSFRGTTSHFNFSSSFNLTMFNLMGVLIVLFTSWTAFMAYLFFRMRNSLLAPAYLWGIRMGMLCYVLFAFQGFVMVALMSHTVGAADGGPGLPVLNWSRQNGDLRVAHFFGMHALQIIPLAGHYVASNKKQILFFSVLYIVWLIVLLIQALKAIPFI